MKKERNFKALFASGICFLGAGIALLVSVNTGVGAGLILLGAAFMIISLKNKDQWRKK